MNRAALTIWGSTLLVSAAIILFVLWPGISSDLTTMQKTKDAQIKLTEASQMKKTLAELNKNNELSNLVTIAKNYIPEASQSGELILELSAIANQAGISVDQLSLEAEKKTAKPATDTTTTPTDTSTPAANTAVAGGSGASEIGFQMTLSGSFDTFKQFLKLTETSSRLISINSLNMSQTTDKFTAQISGKSYYKKATTFSGNIADITLSTTTIEKLQNLKTYANPIDTQNEAGFGRTNPFETIQ